MIRKLLDIFRNRRDPYSRFIISNGPVRVESNVDFAKKIQIGSYTFVGKNSTLGPNLVSIGKFCSIGSGVILGPNNHPTNALSTSAVFYSRSWGFVSNSKKSEYNNRPVVIENDVWIGSNAIVIGPVTLGNGSVIAAGSVVTKNVPAFAIVAGVPAQIIKYRFDEKTISNIQRKEWWNLPLDRIFIEYETHSKSLQSE
jgi:acetyltransferase-like isoleucine patch superfamily enzyme